MSATISGQATTYNNPNFHGPLFLTNALQTAFTTMLGGLSGGSFKTVAQEHHTWSEEDLPAAAQPSVLEGADPTYEERDRTQGSNVVQIYQYGFEVSYTKQAATAQMGNTLAPSAIAGKEMSGPGNPVTNEMAHQSMLKVMRAKRDYNHTALQGTYVAPTTNASARQTRGVLTAITTNTVAAGTTDLSATHINDVVKQMVDSGAPFTNPVAFGDSLQKQRFSAAYAIAPESRNVGGVNIRVVETDFANVGVTFDLFMPAGQVGIFDMSIIKPVALPIPDPNGGVKGVLFTEPLSQSGAAWKWQLYAELGIEYGPEQWHGKITGLTTS